MWKSFAAETPQSLAPPPPTSDIAVHTANVFGETVFGRSRPATTLGTAFSHHSPSSDPVKQESLELLLRKLLLGEELVNTQFHLFSARSLPSRRIIHPRILCANNVLLAKSSKYFLDLLSSDINPDDSSLSDITDDNDVPSNVPIDDYGYESDSDLDECIDVVPDASQSQAVTLMGSPTQISSEPPSKGEDELSDDGSESVSSDMFVMSPEEPKTDEPFKGGAKSVVGTDIASLANLGNETSTNQHSVRLRSLGSRHVLVKDTAFQTWYTLLNYLSAGKVSFLPLSSTAPGGKTSSSTSSQDEPKCSAKSMYRLACKIGLDPLRNEALAHIRSNLTEHNILEEISCSIVSKYPQLLETELDVLYAHIASPSVVANFPDLVRRAVNRELLHGADIILDIHARFLKELHPLSSTEMLPQPPSPLPAPSSHLSSFANFGSSTFGQPQSTEEELVDISEDGIDTGLPSKKGKKASIIRKKKNK